MRSHLAAFAALSMIVGSTAASAQVGQTAAPAAVERAGAPVGEASELRGTTGWILAAIALGLIIWGATELFDDDEDDFPTSP